MVVQMFAMSGSVIYATQYPEACQSSQTTTSVSSPGADLYFGILCESYFSLCIITTLN